MFSPIGFVKRNWDSARPTELPKNDGALRIGLFGASNIAPMAIITPAKTHPDFIIAAIAARDIQKAQAYAKKHNIPVVHNSYQELLDDPTLDAVYIPLPNGLHYEWAVKAIKAKKHVLLEKPSTSNSTEAKSLFQLPELSQPNAPILLEAFHSCFHPAWQRFLSLLTPKDITHVTASQFAPKGVIPNNDIRYKFDLSGGVMMDFGTYGVGLLRQVFADEPTECVHAEYVPMPPGFDNKIDYAFKAKWRFPNDGVAELEASLSATGGWSLPWLTKSLPRLSIPCCTVDHREHLVPDEAASAKGHTHSQKRKVTMWNSLMPGVYHRIDLQDVHTVRNSENKTLKTWTDSSYIKAYTWDSTAQQHQAGTKSPPWSSYRHQLEEFVNRVRGRPGSGIWFDGESSIKQMTMIDGAYAKMGLPIRPTSKYL